VEKFEHVLPYFVYVFFKREVSCIEHMEVDVFKIALVWIGTVDDAVKASLFADGSKYQLGISKRYTTGWIAAKAWI